MWHRALLIAMSLVFLAFSATPQAVDGMTLDQLIEKNVEARGGMKKLKAIRSMRITGKALMGGARAMGGAQVPMQVVFKRPNLIRLEIVIQGQTMVQAFDGKTGWQILPFMGSKDPQKIPQEEVRQLEEYADIDGPLVDYEKKGHTVSLAGKDEIEGTPVYKLKLKLKNGEKRTLYLDAENHIELKSTAKRKRQGNEFEIDTYLGDYKEVGGVMMAHTFENRHKGKTVMQVTFEKIELNVAVNDAVFKMPPRAKGSPPAKKDSPEPEKSTPATR